MTKTITPSQIIFSHAEELFVNAQIGIAVVKHSGTLKQCNPFFYKLFGYTTKELSQKNIYKLFPVIKDCEEGMSWQKYFEKVVNDSTEVNTELFALKKDGTIFPVHLNCGSYTIDGNSYIAFFISDNSRSQKEKVELSESNQLLQLANENRNKELRRAASTLEMVNERLEVLVAEQKAILDNVGIMLFVTNKRGIIKYFNPESTYLTGYTRDEVVEQFTPTLFIENDGIQQCRSDFQQEYGLLLNADFDVISEYADLGKLNKKECVYRKKDDSKISVLLTITPVKDKNKLVTGYLGVAMDVGEQKWVEFQLKEALQKEIKLGEMKSRFVSMASHEFRTPLSTISSSAFLAKKYSALDQQQKREKHLDTILSSVGLLTNILNDFLSVGKIEEGKMPVNHHNLDIKKQTEEIIDSLSSSKKDGQKIEYCHKGEQKIYLDGHIYNNILNNLISNAIKFSPKDSAISVTTLVEKQAIKIQVKDEGMGISDEDQKSLMQRFHRGTNATHIQGTGLGLHIVSKYVERLNGKIYWKSKENAGTTFFISLLRINEE
jgi:PAS domain S-box-containing protein